MSRTTEKQRETAETQIKLSLDLDGGEASAETGVGFLDHMLDLLARHGRLGLKVEANGDLETGAHHTGERGDPPPQWGGGGAPCSGRGPGGGRGAPAPAPAATARPWCRWTSRWPSA